jgi:ubiquinone biosynthesis protein COQ4
MRVIEPTAIVFMTAPSTPSTPGAQRRNLPGALAALRVLLRDPCDTAQGFRLIEAIDPYVHHRELARMRSDLSGRRLLLERPVLLHALQRRRELEALPDGSLGRAYHAHCVREGIAPEQFVRVGKAGSQADALDNDLVRYAAHRARDSHDLWHVVCGFRSDLAGEAGILGFTLAQTRSPGLALLFLGGLAHSWLVGSERGRTMRRLAWRGLRSGLKALPLAAAPWEDWLSRPLEQVRADLQIDDVPSYEPAYAEAQQRRAAVA